MELIELLNRIRMIWGGRLVPGAKSFIFISRLLKNGCNQKIPLA
jgi:hypothetical protein